MGFKERKKERERVPSHATVSWAVYTLPFYDVSDNYANPLI